MGLFLLYQRSSFRFNVPVCSSPESGSVIGYAPLGTTERACGSENIPKHLGCMVTIPTVLYQAACERGQETMLGLATLPSHWVPLQNDTLSQIPVGRRGYSKSYCWLQLTGQFNTGRMRSSCPPEHPGYVTWPQAPGFPLAHRCPAPNGVRQTPLF